MSKVLLVGHCGPDSTYLRMTVKSALGAAVIRNADDLAEVEKSIADGVDLILVNRELGWGFDSTAGVDLIKSLKSKHPQLKLMLISNYAEAQAEAVAAGALPGFGKRQIGSPHATKLIHEAMGIESQA